MIWSERWSVMSQLVSNCSLVWEPERQSYWSCVSIWSQLQCTHTLSSPIKALATHRQHYRHIGSQEDNFTSRSWRQTEWTALGVAIHGLTRYQSNRFTILWIDSQREEHCKRRSQSTAFDYVLRPFLSTQYCWATIDTHYWSLTLPSKSLLFCLI